jgi:DNA-binding LacI/PurR family transcriptional regulator
MPRALSKETPSKKLADAFLQKIICGEWAVGASLPSTRALAVEYSTSPNTVQRAFGVLAAQGLVERTPGRGSVVKSRSVGNFNAGQKAMQIAVISPAQEGGAREKDDWITRIVRAAEPVMLKADYHVTLLSYQYEDADMAAQPMSLIDRCAGQLAGAILFICPEIERIPAELDKRNIPWVTINPVSENVVHNFVTADNYNGGRLVGRLFAALGYERVLYFGGAMRHGSSSGAKFHGLVQGYMEGGKALQNLSFVVCDDPHFNSGAEGLRALVARSGLPRAIFAAGDILAAEATRVCGEAGARVPEDVGVVGSTNMQMAEYHHPSLSVLAQPMEELGRAAAEMLQEMIRTKHNRLPGRFISSPFIVRESLPVPADLLARITAELAREAVPTL